MDSIEHPNSQNRTRSKKGSYQKLLNDENDNAPDFLRTSSLPDMGSQDISKERYISKTYFEQEMDLLWPRVWQMVCRIEELDEVGKCLLYEVGKNSFIVTRTGPDTIKAFYNSCLHRGRQLVTQEGVNKQFRCPYHAFTWKLDGTFMGAPFMWDFPHLDKKKNCLPEAKIDTWGGFVFINWDDNPQPLQDFLGVLPHHFAGWPLEDCFKAVHVRKLIRANWKIVWEAFLEVYHVEATHPQVAPYTSSEESQFDVFGDNISRTITPQGLPTGTAFRKSLSESQLFEGLINTSGRMSEDDSSKVTLPDGISARDHMAELNRSAYSQATGLDLTSTSRSELMDCIFYSVFPNFSPWGGFTSNIIYRVLPHKNDPTMTTMDVMLLARTKKGAPKPPPAKITHLGADEPFANAKELGALGPLFDQDMENIPYIHKGLEASKKNGVTLANYHESRIRHFHQTLDKYMTTRPEEVNLQ